MKTLTIKLEDAIYERLLTAGTKGYQEEVNNPDYDPNVEGSLPTKPNPHSKDDHLLDAVEASVKQILLNHEVNEVSDKAVAKKQKEIESLSINTEIS